MKEIKKRNRTKKEVLQNGKTRCLVCKGEGEIEHPKSSPVSKLKLEAALLLSEYGYTGQQISEMVGYESSTIANRTMDIERYPNSQIKFK